MNSLLIQSANAILRIEKAENVSILIENEKIKTISFENETFAAAEILDLRDTTLFAGFIDVHNHGAIGFDVNSANADDLREVALFLAKSGVTAWLPTLVPDSLENYWKSIKAIDELIKIQANLPIAQAVGVHYEGVFANEKMCGALRPEFFKSFINGDEINFLPKL